MRPLPSPVELFGEHINGCQRCSNRPLDLCDKGAQLMLAAILMQRAHLTAVQNPYMRES